MSKRRRQNIEAAPLINGRVSNWCAAQGVRELLDDHVRWALQRKYCFIAMPLDLIWTLRLAPVGTAVDRSDKSNQTLRPSENAQGRSKSA